MRPGEGVAQDSLQEMMASEDNIAESWALDPPADRVADRKVVQVMQSQLPDDVDEADMRSKPQQDAIDLLRAAARQDASRRH